MSRPATSCSRRYTDSASVYCSRNLLFAIASTNDLVPRFSVYQLGRGSEPMIVVGKIFPLVAFSIYLSLSLLPNIKYFYAVAGARRRLRNNHTATPTTGHSATIHHASA